jgi:hypothetical protein
MNNRQQFWVIFGEDMIWTDEQVIRDGEAVGNSFMRAAVRISNRCLGKPLSTRVQIFRLTCENKGQPCAENKVFDGTIFEFNGFIPNPYKYSLTKVDTSN